jgi:hypothetical protein
VRVRRTLEPDMARHEALTPAYREFVVALIDRGWWRE